MTKSFLIFIILVLIGGAGAHWYLHKDDNRLRMDACQLRASGGPIADGATISAADTLKLQVTLRGCTADSSQMCKANIKANIVGPSKTAEFTGLNSALPFSFRKNSAITSMEAQAEGTGFTPGDYIVTITAEDLNANKTVEKKFTFSTRP